LKHQAIYPLNDLCEARAHLRTSSGLQSKLKQPVGWIIK